MSVDGQPVVSLPGNAMVTDDGEAYAGQAVVSVAALDPSQDPTVMPGDFLGWDAESQTAAPIESYGAVDVALAADNGAPLQLGSDDPAQVSIPLARDEAPGRPRRRFRCTTGPGNEATGSRKARRGWRKLHRAAGPMSGRWGISRPGTRMSSTKPFR